MASLAYADMASEHGGRKVEHESQNWRDGQLSTLEVVMSALTMRGGAMDGGRVIVETTRRDVRLSGSSWSYFLKY